MSSGIIESHFSDNPIIDGVMFDDLSDCLLNKEDLAVFNAPFQQDWDDYLSSHHAACVTMDSAKAEQWEWAKVEIQHIRNRLVILLGSEENVTVQNVIHFCLGPDSDIGIFIRKELKMGVEKYLRFMGTLFVQASYKVSSSQLYDKHSLLKSHALLSETEYNEVWKDWSEKRKLKSAQIRTGRGEKCLWEELEGIINGLCRSISIVDRRGKIGMAVDDDKVWLNLTQSVRDDLFGLRFAQHVQANRKGIIGHTAVSTGANVPLGIALERTKDSTIDCFKRLLESMFNRVGVIDLSNIFIFSDRGYMLPTVVFDFLISHGANIVGTVKRMAQCWPFTFDQKLKPNDKRTLIDSKGAPALFLKAVRKGTQKVFASAFRNGSGRVATAISSVHKRHQWEGIVLHHSELCDYKLDPKLLVPKFFSPINDLMGVDILFGEYDSREELNRLLQDEVDPMSLRQGTADWFWLRKFSFTSSQAHAAFVAAFPLHSSKPSWIAVAQFLFGSAWKDKLIPPASNDIAGTPSTTVSPGGDEIDHSLHDFVTNFNVSEYDYFAGCEKAAEDALEIVRTFVHGDGDEHTLDSSSDAGTDGVGFENEEVTIQNLSNMSHNIRRCVIQILLQYIPEAERCSKQRHRTDLILWLHQPNSVRKYLFRNKKSLQDLLSRRCLKISGSKSIQAMVNTLAGVVQPFSSTESDSSEILPQPPEDARTKTIQAVLKRSFMPHQKGTRREYCTIGHKLEKPILQRWIDTVTNPQRENTPRVRVKAAFGVGLAAKKGMRFAKDSLDAVLTVEDDYGDIKSWGFEAKGRVTPKTAADEEHFLYDIDFDDHIRISAEKVSATVGNVSERFQVLHHSFVYNFDTVVLAIGDEQAELIRSLVIDFPANLRNDYKAVLKDLKALTLDWAYTNEQAPIKIPDEVVRAAEEVKTINGHESLQCNVNVWSALSSMALPIPSFAKLIPITCAYWNAVKSGSDTTTKLIDSCPLFLPFTNCETVASARLLMLCCVLIHRLCQIITADEDINTYQSLYNYRNNASHRMTFHSTLISCHNAFKTELDHISNEAVTSNEKTLSPQSTPSRRQPSRAKYLGRSIHEVDFAYKLPSGTPTKMAKMTERVKEAKAPVEIENMFKKCTGVPMKMVDGLKSAPRCMIDGCRATTKWYCATCHRWVCMERKQLKLSKLEPFTPYRLDVAVGEKGNKETKKIIFQRVCFHKSHEANWRGQNNGN